MVYSQMLRELFPDLTLQAEDLLLLESFQIEYLPERVAREEFATLLRENPVVNRYLLNKHPPIASFLNRLLEEHTPVSDSQQIHMQCQEALWEIADLIIYNKYPELIDTQSRIHWDMGEITSITSLEDKTVADVGAGSGRMAFQIAPFAQTVFAIEPLQSFRSFMKNKVAKLEVHNLFVMDGTLDCIPLPEGSLDVLITSNAIGWKLREELKEIERVVKPGGTAIHLLSADLQQENPYHKILTSPPWNYQVIRNETDRRIKIRYHKIMAGIV